MSASSRRRRKIARRARVRRRRTSRAPAAGSVLAALTSSALALPGLSERAAASTPIERPTADYRFSFYSEDSVPSSRLAGGSPDRYEIEVHQFHAAAPLGDRTDVEIDVSHESMSGASPWFVIPEPGTGRAVQVMSGATIEERRTDATVKGNLHFDAARASLSSGISVENDYLAVSGGLDGAWDLNEKHTTASAGAAVSIDRIRPTDPDRFPTRPREKHKQSVSVFGGIAQVIHRAAAIQSTLTYRYSTGYLSDPYKLAHVEGATRPDSRPGARHQGTWLTRYRQHFSRADGTLHADYRFFVDDWSITSHTFELAWYQSLWDAMRLIPSFRYYSQSQAKFYEPYFTTAPADGYHSSDYRLSPYGALSWGIKAETDLRPFGRIDWLASFTWQQYWSDGDLALGKVSVSNPGLVSYHLFSIGLKGRF